MQDEEFFEDEPKFPDAPTIRPFFPKELRLPVPPERREPPDIAINGDQEAITWYQQFLQDPESSLGDMTGPSWHTMYRRYCEAIGRPLEDVPHYEY